LALSLCQEDFLVQEWDPKHKGLIEDLEEDIENAVCHIGQQWFKTKDDDRPGLCRVHPKLDVLLKKVEAMTDPQEVAFAVYLVVKASQCMIIKNVEKLEEEQKDQKEKLKRKSWITRKLSKLCSRIFRDNVMFYQEMYTQAAEEVNTMTLMQPLVGIFAREEVQQAALKLHFTNFSLPKWVCRTFVNFFDMDPEVKKMMERCSSILNPFYAWRKLIKKANTCLGKHKDAAERFYHQCKGIAKPKEAATADSSGSYSEELDVSDD